MKSYFAYIRVSTVKQGEHGSSLQEQRSAIEAYAARQNLSIAAWFEETETAAKQGRTHFTKMLAQLERSVAQGVIIHKIDRSARNLKDWANLGELIDRGIDVHFVHDSVDLRSRGGRLSADIQAVVAADFIRNLRDEVRKGYYGRLKQGLYPLPAPVGYINKGKGKPKEPDPITAPLVRQAFELYATGTTSLMNLRIVLDRSGLRSPYSMKPLSLNGISRMLNNPFYIGLIFIKRTNETFQGVHQPLVKKSVFDRVQAILRGKFAPRTHKHDFLFRRMVRCTTCGYHLIGERKKFRYVYYRCHNCHGVCVREEILDNAVEVQLRMLEWDEERQQAAKEEAVLMQKDVIGDLKQMQTSLNMQLAKCDDRLGRLTDAYVDQLIDKELFEARKKNVLGDRRAVLDRIAGLSDMDLPINRALEKLELALAAYSGYKNGISSEKRAIVESVTSNFYVEGKDAMIALKSPFQEIVNFKHSLNCEPRRGDPRTEARQLLGILLALTKDARKGAVSQKQSNKPAA